jgi:predicted DNA-binding protein with PD1-like motif
MHSKLLDSRDETSFALIFDRGDEVMKELTAFATEHSVTAAHFTAIGAFSDAVLGFFDRDRKEYQKIPITEQVEVLSLMGDIALKDDAPKVHAPVVVGKADGTAHGGHMLEGHVWPTLDGILTDAPRYLRREHDPATGLALIDLEASYGVPT